MKKTIRDNIKIAYSLHDMRVIDLEVVENTLTLKTQSGIIRVTGIAEQVDGYVEFHNIDCDFCYVYILDLNGNEGKFCGVKKYLKDFISDYAQEGFSIEIIDETYGYNQTKFSGYLSEGQTVKECMIEIYHLGDMVYVEN